MNNPIELPANKRIENRPDSFPYLITKGLNYCCPWFFLRRFEKVSADLIAARLGCHRRTVFRWRVMLRAEEIRCEGCKRCMAAKLAP